MFLLRKSYHSNWRVFLAVSNSMPVAAHQDLREKCMWGGHDKSEVIDGMTYYGYEFDNIESATTMVNKIVADYL